MMEYRQNDVIKLPMTVQDEHGVQIVYATAYRVEDSPTSETESTTNSLQARPTEIRLGGQPLERDSKPQQVELQATVTTENPGEYEIREIQSFDMLSQVSHHPLDSIIRFRIKDSPEDDRRGPDVLEVGELS